MDLDLEGMLATGTTVVVEMTVKTDGENRAFQAVQTDPEIRTNSLATTTGEPATSTADRRQPLQPNHPVLRGEAP